MPCRCGTNLLGFANLRNLATLSRRSIPHSSLAFIPHPSHRVDSAAIAQAVKHLGRFTTEHVLDHLGLPVTKANEMAVAKQARDLGYVKARVCIEGSQYWVFFPPQEAAS